MARQMARQMVRAMAAVMVTRSIAATSGEFCDPLAGTSCSLEQSSGDACIDRVSAISDAEFEQGYWNRQPVVLANVSENAAARKKWTRRFLSTKYGSIELKANKAAALSLAGQGQGTVVSLKSYLRQLSGGPKAKTTSDAAARNMETENPNEKLYLFDRGEFFSKARGLAKGFDLPSLSKLDYGPIAEQRSSMSGGLVLALGDNGTGIPFHYHTESWLEVLHGEKRWCALHCVA
eukprot:SAG31_NODE_70_length_28117_cov_100.521843_15_plen_234_part_00